MSEEDGYTRVTLRIPKKLTIRLKQSANRRSHSMNAEIIQRIWLSYDYDDKRAKEIQQAIEEEEALLDDLEMDKQDSKEREDARKERKARLERNVQAMLAEKNSEENQLMEALFSVAELLDQKISELKSSKESYELREKKRRLEEGN